MSAQDILLITSIIGAMGIVRFGLPVLVIWAVRQIGERTIYRHA